MLEWFNEKSLFEQVYWLIGICATLVFLIILIMTFFGGDTELDDMDTDGADGDVDGSGFHFFTFKNLVGFFTIFAWTGIGCIHAGFSAIIVLSISIFCGLLMMLAMSLLFYFMTRLVEEGTMKMSNAIGRTAEVYLPIKGKNGGFGKVHINVQGSLHELQAMTNDEEDLSVGTIVKVQNVIDNSILLVTRKLD